MIFIERVNKYNLVYKYNLYNTNPNLCFVNIYIYMRMKYNVIYFRIHKFNRFYFASDHVVQAGELTSCGRSINLSLKSLLCLSSRDLR